MALGSSSPGQNRRAVGPGPGTTRARGSPPPPRTTTMPSTIAQLLDHLRRLTPCARADVSDAVLLGRFCRRHDDTAFADLVARHGPLVLRVCRRTLDNPQDIEDAFQATFLTLARGAGTIRRPEALAAWLHGVARRISLRARRDCDRSRRRTAGSTPLDPPDPRPGPLDEL